MRQSILRSCQALSIMLLALTVWGCSTVDFYPSVYITNRSDLAVDVFALRTETVEQARAAALSGFQGLGAAHHFTKRNEEFIFEHSPEKDFICIGFSTASSTVSYAILKNERYRATGFFGGAYQTCFLYLDPAVGLSVASDPPDNDYTKGLLVEIQ